MTEKKSSRTRREFLTDVGSTAGIVFLGCGVAERALDAGGQAQSGRGAAAAKHAPVTIRGRRIRTVDIHAHCAFPESVKMLGREAIRQDTLALEGQLLTDRIATMDRQGIDIAVLSINAIWYDAERDLVTKLIAMQNEKLADFCGSHADRFTAFASVALQFPDLAAQQLEYAMKKLGLRGAAIGGSVAGLELSNEKFNPFWAKAEELGAAIFIHPQPTDDLSKRLQGNGLLTNVIWNPLETTIALSHLIFEGTLDRYPGLKIIGAHGGGFLGSYMNRSDHGCVVFPEQCKPGLPKKTPTEYIKKLYFDSLVFTPEALRHLAAEVGAGQIVVGTDFPYPWVSDPIDHVLKTPGLSDADREAILGGTAAKLLGLRATS
jgi:aminocarboxymuconate-semialdehyde decarboxylase